MARKIKIESEEAPPDAMNNPFANVPIDQLPGGEDIADSAKGRGRVAMRLETKGGDKQVIVIGDFADSVTKRSLQQLTRKLRNACGCTGQVRERTIQIHGDRMDKVRDILEDEGFWVSGA